MSLFETICDLERQADLVRARRYGVIETEAGEFRRLLLRPFPRVSSLGDVLLAGRCFHRLWPGDRCWLYYNQPRAYANFLALKYVVSTRTTRLATFRGALAVLDEVARIKRTDAIVCDAVNARISDRLLARWGWQPHKPQRWHRNYIKRLYGNYSVSATCSCGQTDPFPAHALGSP